MENHGPVKPFRDKNATHQRTTVMCWIICLLRTSWIKIDRRSGHILCPTVSLTPHNHINHTLLWITTSLLTTGASLIFDNFKQRWHLCRMLLKLGNILYQLVVLMDLLQRSVGKWQHLKSVKENLFMISVYFKSYLKPSIIFSD